MFFRMSVRDDSNDGCNGCKMFLEIVVMMKVAVMISFIIAALLMTASD